MKKSLLMMLLLSGCAATANSDETISDVSVLAVGLHERYDRDQLETLLGIDPVDIPWCAAYVNYVLDLNGVEGTGSLVAKSYLRWGTPVDTPRPWDIVIFHRNGESWQGHVGFYMGTVDRDGQQYYRVLGGNQSDAVTVEEYSTEKIAGIRRWLE